MEPGLRAWSRQQGGSSSESSWLQELVLVAGLVTDAVLVDDAGLVVVAGWSMTPGWSKKPVKDAGLVEDAGLVDDAGLVTAAGSANEDAEQVDDAGAELRELIDVGLAEENAEVLMLVSAGCERVDAEDGLRTLAT